MDNSQKAIEYVEYRLRRVAAFLGIIQGVAWIAMCAICIALYIKESSYITPKSYMESISVNIYFMFLARTVEDFPKEVLPREGFLAFMWLYLILNVVWIFSSFRIRGKVVPRRKSIIRWAQLTFTISLVDLAFVIILGAHFSRCLTMDGPKIAVEELCSNTVIIVLVIAARGFVLWILNCVFAYVILKIGRRVRITGSQVPNVNVQIQSQYPTQPSVSHNSYLASSSQNVGPYQNVYQQQNSGQFYPTNYRQ